MYIDQAIESILNQTYSNLELIIVNADPNMIKSLECWELKDKRIKVINKLGLSVAPSRSLALKESTGKYIAIHDSDDYSDPTRIEKQVNYLESHPNIGCVSSYLKIIYPDNTIKCNKYALKPFLIKFYSYFEYPLGHGTVMYRGDIIRKHKLKYRGILNGFPEDYDFHLQMIGYCDFACIPEYLYFYRMNQGNTSDINIRTRLNILTPIIQRSNMHKRYGFILRNSNIKTDILPYIIKFSRKERLNLFQFLWICISFAVFMVEHRVHQNTFQKKFQELDTS